MTKRTMWWLTCIMFAVFWGLIGVFIWPVLILSLLSLMMIMVPVGVPDKPTHVHDAHKWTP